MKVCKKCKKLVANKSKICKYCGADVSKAEIIKNPVKKSSPLKKTNNTVKKTKQEPVKETKPVVETKKEEKKKETKVLNPVIEKTESKKNILEKINIKSKLNGLKDKLSELKEKLKTKKTEEEKEKTKKQRQEKREKTKAKLKDLFENIKGDIQIKKKVRKNKRANKKVERKEDKEAKLKAKAHNRKDKYKELFKNKYTNIDKLELEDLKEITKEQKKAIKDFKKLERAKKRARKVLEKYNGIFKNKFNINKIDSLSFEELKELIKDKKNKIKNKLKDEKIKARVAKLDEKAKLKQEKEEVKNKKIEEKEKEKEQAKESKKSKEVEKVKKPVKHKKIQFLAKIIIILGIICSIAGASLYFLNNSAPTEVSVIKGEEATNDKIFSIGDVINHNGVSYKIANVRTSNGNSYSVPREGKTYLIITIYIINNTNHEIDYSYNSWVLSDKKNRKAKFIFSSINVEDALYSGKLKKGVTKRGSIIFEESKKAEQMRLSFYDVEIDQNKEEKINYNKRVFSVNIEMPKDTNKSSKQ